LRLLFLSIHYRFAFAVTIIAAISIVTIARRFVLISR
jgi:hypothetical protein